MIISQIINNSCTSQDKLDYMSKTNPLKPQWFKTKVYLFFTACYLGQGGGLVLRDPGRWNNLHLKCYQSLHYRGKETLEGLTGD